MNKFLLAGIIAFCSYAYAQEPLPTKFIFFQIKVIDHDKLANEKFFISRLPHIGETVEWVYTGNEQDGTMNFQLKTKELEIKK